MYENGKGELTGLDIELIQEIFKIINCPIRFRKMPFKRALYDIEKGELDVSTSVQKKVERKRFALYTLPYRYSTIKLIHKTNKHFNTMEEALLNLKQIGITRGYYYGESLKLIMDDPRYKTRFEEAGSDEHNLQKLILGRIGGILADPVVIKISAQKKNLIGPLKVNSKSFEDTKFYIIFSKKIHSQKLVDKVNEAIIELEKKGIYQQILNKYQILN